MPDMVGLFDIDGTLADFNRTMDEAMRNLATPEEVESGTYFPREQESEAPHIKTRRRLIKSQPGFWRNLPKMPLGFRLLEHATSLGFSIAILTKAPRRNFAAWSEKVEWCHLNLPMDRGITVNLVEDKGLVYGRFLVDDYPPYIEKWLAWRPRGIVIMPEQPWNLTYRRDRVIPINLKNVDDVAYKAMAEARNR
jgi:5'(3')-deoxyribonucleotidase